VLSKFSPMAVVAEKWVALRVEGFNLHFCSGRPHLWCIAIHCSILIWSSKLLSLFKLLRAHCCYVCQVGFFTGRKRESIFKSPDDPKGKVGVTGSGKGTTGFQKREKHLHLRVAGEDGDDLIWIKFCLFPKSSKMLAGEFAVVNFRTWMRL